MEIRERKFDAILLDVDGTLLDFGMSEKQGMKVVLEQYGFEPTEERLLLYHEINEGFWSAFERGEVTKEDLLCLIRFFGRLNRQDVDDTSGIDGQGGVFKNHALGDILGW